MDELKKTEENIGTELTPQQYFEKIKDRKHHITDAELVKVYDNCLDLLNKYKITGQQKGMRKLMFHLECIEKEREIPDEIVEVVAAVKDKFDQLYVVFTDYTGKVERQVEKERREKDPILFGTFQNPSNRTVIDRFYYLGDWEDEYCDLTLDKMVNETEKAGKRNIVKTISTPKDIEELREQLSSLSEINGNFIVSATEAKPKKRGFFANIKTFLTGKTK